MAFSEPDMSEHGPDGSTASRAVPVIEEMVNVQVVPVDQGGWHIAKKVSVTQQQVDLEVQDVGVQIERRPIGRPLDGIDAPPPRYEGNTLIFSVVEEVLMTEKRLMLVEEVRITEVRETRQVSKQVALRKETVTVDRLAPDGRASEESDTSDTGQPTREAG